MISRKKTKQISVGKVKVGGNAPVSVQSMTNTDTRDIDKTVLQIKNLESAGCEIVRVAVLDDNAATVLKEIKSQINIPLIADIHFDYRLAVKAIEQGVDCIRINPGNIGTKEEVGRIVCHAKEKSIPIRVGVNAGSLEKDLLKKYRHPTAEAMVESAIRSIQILEGFDYDNIKLSIKGSRVIETVEAYRLISKKVDYPLHIGISEAGPVFSGTVKSAVGLGILLSEGIGDTIRVSLTTDPVEEVKVAYEILKSLELRTRGVNIISCPTCGRLEVDLVKISNEVEERLRNIREPLNISILGCIVNGIGEGKEADIGIAGGKGTGILFRKGQLIKKVREEDIVETLVKEVEDLIKERKYAIL